MTIVGQPSYAGSEAGLSSSILKIKNYSYNSLTNSYVVESYGSAVYIGKNQILTNAHVILDGDGKDPTGLYEVCSASDFTKDPVCFSTAKLISYDLVADIALLEISPSSKLTPVELSKKKTSDIGSSVIIYGYPSIGGSTITRAEGKLAGFAGGVYKIDATIDHGSSEGGAFDADGKMVGMPYRMASDTTVIGYMIPSSMLVTYLAGKSESMEKAKTVKDTKFEAYIAEIEKLSKNPAQIVNSMVKIPNISKLGFRFIEGAESLGESIFSYSLLDKNSRVSIEVACSKDTSARSFLDMTRSYSWALSVFDTDYSYAKEDVGNDLYIKKSQKKSYTNDTELLGFYYYAKSPACSAAIHSKDGLGKDKRSYENALKLVKGITFPKPLSITRGGSVNKLFESPEPMIPIYLTEDIESNGERGVGVKFFFDEKVVSDFIGFRILSFADQIDYFNINYKPENLYKGADHSFSAFYSRYITKSLVQSYHSGISKNGKQFILTKIDNTNGTDGTRKYVFFYPFKKDGKYYALYAEGSVNSLDSRYFEDIMSYLESLTLPGETPFE